MDVLWNQLTAYSMVLLRSGDRYLMLKRAEHKTFAPGRWTGLGGRVEADEFDDLQSAALRELQEETGILPSQVDRFRLRRMLLDLQPSQPLTVLLYFTGELGERVTPVCTEGELHWLSERELSEIDIIENTRQVIPLLIDDMQRDPAGRDQPVPGAAAYAPDGALRSIVWSGGNNTPHD